MGVLPLEFSAGESVASLKLTGREVFELVGSGQALRPRGEITVRAVSANADTKVFTAKVRIDTPEELTAFSHGGILPYVLRKLANRHE